MGKMMTEEEVAERFAVPSRTLAQWRYRKVGPPYVKIGAHVRYDAAALDEYIRRQTVSTAADG